jgi:glycosyltransferase involved in cell wall biosynthesis
MLRRMDTVVFGAHAQAHQWRARFGIATGRSRVIHNGVDAQCFVPPDGARHAAARAELGLPAGAPVAVCVAQLRREKAHDVLLEAFARAGSDGARLVLVGDGVARTALAAQAGRLGIADRVVFAGEVADVRAWLEAADVFVLASVAVETFSNAALEAAACGLPVVTTDIGGARELVEEGHTGYVVAPHDADALAAALGRLLDDPLRGRAMGEAGRRRVLEGFSFARMLEDWVEVIWSPNPGRAAEAAA